MSNSEEFVCVPIALGLYCELVQRYGHRANGVIESVVEDFLERTADDDFGQSNAAQGVNWERIFLDDGTQLRVKYKNEYVYAHITGDKVMFNDEVFPSISQAVRQMRNGIPTNAWKVVELLRPRDGQWRRADKLRT